MLSKFSRLFVAATLALSVAASAIPQPGQDLVERACGSVSPTHVRGHQGGVEALLTLINESLSPNMALVNAFMAVVPALGIFTPLRRLPSPFKTNAAELLVVATTIFVIVRRN